MIVENVLRTSGQYDSVGIFRLQLFKLSETFIPAQVGHYHRYRPFYIGRKVFGKAPEGADIVLPQSGMLPALRMVCLRDPSYFAAALGDRRPALLHAHFAIDATFALPLARRLDVPLVVTLHGFDVTRDSASLLRSGRPSWVNFVLWQHQLKREATLFVCVSEFIREQALARGYPAERTVTVPVGIDLQKFQPAADLEPKLIVQVARLVEKKGVLYLIRAVARIVARDRSVTLVIIGDGPLRSALEAEVASLGIGENVRFMGSLPHDETIGWMRRATLIAVPSVTASSGDSEGLPTVLLEAAALGVPVVASRTSGIPEAVLDGQTGYLVAERDVDGLAERIQRVLEDPALRHAMGRAARELMISEFDIVRQTAKLEALYGQIRYGSLGRQPLRRTV